MASAEGRAESMTEDRGQLLVTGDGHQGISHSGIGIPAIGSREPEAGSRNPNGRNLAG
jgi:hypothetical protein